MLDTALALEALTLAGVSDAAIIAPAVGFLLSRQQASGGWADGENVPSVSLTALSLSALQRFTFTYNVSASVDKAREFLFTSQAPGGGWGEDWQTAVTLLAVVPVTTDVARYAPAVTLLQSRQLANGAWANDSFTTALALRALHLVANIKLPVSPTEGRFTGRVVNDATSAPLAGVGVSVNGTTLATASAADGGFTLSGVPPGSHTLTYQLPGFGGATQGASVQAGQIVDLGTIRLAPLPSVGTVTGAVTDAATGLAIAGATVQATGAVAVAVATDANGAYRIVSPPGSITLVVNAAGYAPASGTGTVVAGGELIFSPALTAASTPGALLKGTVTAAATGAPLPGVLIGVTGATTASAVTDAQGNYQIGPLNAGAITITASLAGYDTVTVQAQASVGGTLIFSPKLYATNTTPPIGSTTGTVHGTATNAATGAPLAGAAVTVSGVAAPAFTDAAGKYQIANVPAGTVTITVALAGYSPASGTGLLSPSGSVEFSPALPPANPQVTLKGKAVDADSSAPLPGVLVSRVGGTGSATTGAAGDFLIAGLAAGELSFDLSKTGYQTLRMTLVAPAGSVVNVGTVMMPKTVAATTTTVVGKVTDAATLAPIAGASVTIVGAGLSAVTGADGGYRIEGITTLQFSVSASAVGYLSQSGNVTLVNHGTVTVDIPLARAQPSNFDITRMTSAQTSYPALASVKIDITLANTGSGPVTVILFIKVANATGQIVDEYPGITIPMGGDPNDAFITVAPGATHDMQVPWHTNRHPPGAYQVIVQAFDVGNRLLAERSLTLQVESTTRIGGHVDFDPPIAQLAANKPVAISDDITNQGNQPIGPGTATAQVTLRNPGYQSNPAYVTVETLVAEQGLKNPQGSDMDAAGNLYVANNGANNVLKITPAGAVSVFATGLSSPVDVDIDSLGNIYVLNSSNSFVRFGTNGSRTQVNTQLSAQQAIEALDDGRVYIVRSNALHEVATDGTVRQIIAGGLASPQGLTINSKGEVFIANRGENSIAKYSTAGALSTFATGINQPYGITVDAADNLYVTGFGSNSLHKITPAGVVSTIATGLAGPYDVKIAPDGNFVVSNSNTHQIVSITPAGQVSVLVHTPMYQPNAAAYDAAGNLYIGNGGFSSISKLGTDGSFQTYASGVSSPADIWPAGDGNLYVLESNGNTLSRIAPGGARTVMATGLSFAYAVVPAPDGSGFLVSESNAQRIRHVAYTGQVTPYLEAQFTNPRGMRRDAAGNLFVFNNTAITKISTAGQVSRFASGLANPYDMVFDAVGNLIVSVRTTKQLLRINPAGAVSILATLTIDPGTLALAANGNILVAAVNGTTIYSVDSAGGVASFMTLTRPIYGMLVDGAGHLWAAHYSYGNVTRITPTGVQTVYTVGSLAQALAADGQGGVYVGINGGVKRIDAGGAVSNVIIGGVLASQQPLGLVLDDSARLWVLDTQGVINRFNPDTSLDKRFSTLNSPKGLTLGAGGELLVANTGNSKILKITDPNGLPEVLASSAFERITGEGGSSLLVSNNATVQRLDLASGGVTSLISGFSNLRGVARRADGGIATIDSSRNELGLFANNGTQLDRFIGLVNPKGLLFDATGRLLVANQFPNAISRMRSDGRLEPFSSVTNIHYMTLEPDGRITASQGPTYGQIVTLSASGAQTNIFSSLSPLGLARAVDGSLFVADYYDGALLKHAADGSYRKVASGLSSPRDVERSPTGQLYIADSGRGVVTAVNPDGSLSLVAAELPNVDSITIAPSGVLYAVYTSTKLAVIDPTGVRSELPVGGLLNAGTQSITSIMVNGNTLYGAVGAVNAILEFSIQSAAPVQPGQIVYTATATFPGLDTSGSAQHLDFGAWTPTVSGDYSVEVTLASGPADGTLTNTLHVGPSAHGSFDLAQTQVFPGTLPVTGYLRVLGADSTSVTRIDTSGATLVVSPSTINTIGKAIAADSKGNIYAVAANTPVGERIVKIAPDGVVSNFATDVSIGYGMAIDSKDNLYAVRTNQLLKFAPDGTMSTISVPNISAVAVDYDDQVYVIEYTNRLSRVNPDGSLTLITTVGLYNPRALSIDVYGNFYVLNYNGKIVRITRDGKASLLYEKPYVFYEFEGVNITSDCSNNVLFAPVPSQGEEDRLYQLVGDTGEVRQILYGPSIDRALGDMDVIYFDRLSNRLLVWGHDIWAPGTNNNKIFSFPTVCGAIDAEVQVITSASVDLSSTDPAPTSVTQLADGTAEWTWLLSQVDNRGKQIQLNLLFKDLAEGETRLAAKDAFLVFKNSFVPGETVRVPIEIPSVRAGSSIGLQATLDNTQYGPNSTVNITVNVNNGNPLAFDGTLELSIKDAANATVAVLSLIAIAGQPGLSVTPYSSSWNTGTTIAGPYQVDARLKNAAGKQVADGQVPFSITAVAGSAAVSLRVTTDKSVYHTTDLVAIQNLIANLTTNVIVNNATIRLTILDPANAVFFTKDGPLGQLVPGALLDLGIQVPLVSATLGMYRVEGKVLDATGAVLATGATSYEVRNDLSKSLSGKVTVGLATLDIGTPQTCTDTLTNIGSQTISNLEVHRLLVNLDTQVTHDDRTATLNLAAGQVNTDTRSLSTDGLLPGNYACVLQARLDGALKTLAYASFVVSGQTVKVDATLSLGTKGRVLVLLDSGLAPPPANFSDSDPHGPSIAPLLSAQRAFLEKLLKDNGWSYTITTSAEVFTREMHTGAYTLYAVFAEQEKLSETAQKELREAVFRSEGLVMAGIHDARHHVVHDALGVKLIGQVTQAASSLLTTSPLGLTGGISLLAGDKTLRIKRTTAQSAGVYVLGNPPPPQGAIEPDCRVVGEPPAKPPVDECNGQPNAYLDAFTLNSYGLGKAFFTGFDLLAQATLDGDTGVAAKTLLAALAYANPTPPRLVSGGVVPLSLALQNKGIATTVTTVLTLPAGVSVADLGTDTLTSPTTVRWDVPLAVDEAKTLTVWLRLPTTAGAITFSATVHTQAAPIVLLADPSTTLTVLPPTDLTASLTTVEALIAQNHPEAKTLKQVSTFLTNALKTPKLEHAVFEVLKAADQLLGFTGSALVTLRAALGEWVREAGMRGY